MNREQVVCSDCLEHMRTMQENSVDSIVTDPPYGLSFMNKEWDSFGTDTRQPGDEHYWVPDNPYGRQKVRYGWNQDKSKLRDSMVAFQESMTPIFAEALRVAKPGAHMLCFGGTRTFHRMACAIEDAGWEIRDCIMWTYGSGFPHSMDVSKAIEKKHGADAAAQWDGWGTCLKPAWEPIIVARKPLDGTVANNVLKWGTGALNIEACRVPTDGETPKGSGGRSSRLSGDTRSGKAAGMFAAGSGNGGNVTPATGRFPANLVHDGSQMVLDLFPDTGKSSGGGMHTRGTTGEETTNTYGTYTGGIATKSVGMGDSGSAARFFYCAKASKKERGEGNHHPTIKPIALMRWLVTLVTPEGGVVLDPFAGSGTTLLACKELGRGCIGIEREPEYVEIIKRRLETA